MTLWAFMIVKFFNTSKISHGIKPGGHRMLFFNLPNTITIIRLFIYVGLLVLFLFADAVNKIWVFIAIMANNHILDSVDGIVARKFNMTTVSGKFLDHAGDRMCKSLLMCTLSYMGVFHWFLTAFSTKKFLKSSPNGV